MFLETETPALCAEGLYFSWGNRPVLRDMSLTVYPGEILAIVGESGSGKSTLLQILYGLQRPSAGTVQLVDATGQLRALGDLGQQTLRTLQRTQWAYVQQNPRDALRMGFTVGANLIERLLAMGQRHYGQLRHAARDWLTRVEIDPDRMDDLPETFSGGMLQRLQLARVLISQPRILLLDEPTGGLDVSVQAALLDLLRHLAADTQMAVILVTHDLAVARLLAQRVAVMRAGQIIESGLIDQVLDDPQTPYTQLLVSSVLSL
jgi:putative phosphonate transport system ATP-binding protein